MKASLLRRVRACFLLASVVALAGCGLSESKAKAHLEEDGLTDVKLEASKEGGFKFTAKNKEGLTCTGTINGTTAPGSTDVATFKMCQ